MNRLRGILVGVDFSGACAAALAQGVRIAGWNRAVLRALHVVDALVVTDLADALPTGTEALSESVPADAAKNWPGFVSSHGIADPPPLDVVVGRPAEAIMAAAHAADVDLLVLGVRGAVGEHHPAGPIAKACVRHAGCHVLLAREGHPGAFRRIVVGVDFSPESISALEHAARVALQDESELHVVHVFQPPWEVLHYRAPTEEATPEFRREFENALVGRLKEAGAGAAEEMEYLKPVYALEPSLSHGRGLSDYAKRIGADLAVVGVRGHSTLRTMLLGSTAEKLLAESPCSVLAVRAQREAGAGAGA